MKYTHVQLDICALKPLKLCLQSRKSGLVGKVLGSDMGHCEVAWRRAVDAPESAVLHVCNQCTLCVRGHFLRWVGAARRAREVISEATCKSRGACFFSVRQCGE